MKIYYLDDEIALCDIFEEFISDNQTAVKTFSDANQAIEQCKIEPPDVMFIDYRLADTSGDKVASMLDGDIIKVLVTGELTLPDCSLFLDVVSKPFKLNELKKKIESLRDKIRSDSKFRSDSK